MIEVRPTGAALGADILGADLSRPPAPAAFGAIHRAWMTHVVLRFRGQTLTDEQLMAFSRNFGALDGNPRHAKVEGRADSAAPASSTSFPTSSKTAKPSAGLAITNPSGTAT